jgi:RND family efflux transporter MFP subunit
MLKIQRIGRGVAVKTLGWVVAGGLAVATAGQIWPTSCTAVEPKTEVAASDLWIEDGATRPSESRELGFDIGGMIRKIHVKPGQAVQPGDLLMELDMRVEQKELEILKLAKDSKIEVEAARKQKEYKQAELRRVKNMFDNQTGTQAEYDKAKADVDLADLQIQKAEEEQLAAGIKYEKQQQQLERMKLLSTVEGVVDTVDRKEGQVADPNRPVCTVKSNKPMWVEVYLPWDRAQKLKVGDKVKVNHGDGKGWEDAEMVFRAPEADATSGRQLVRFSMGNEANRDSGAVVQVQIDPKTIGKGAVAGMPATKPSAKADR